jgi:hypothetical protein
MSAGLYRLRAQDCSDNAELTADPLQRANWLSLAEKWQRLATEVEMRQLDLWGVGERSDEPSVSRAQELAFSLGVVRRY